MSLSELSAPGWGGGTDGGRGAAPPVVDLDDDVARDPSLTGGKAAALATARAAGLDTLPGVVLTTAFSPDTAVIRDAFHRAGGPTTTLVARSSSVVEDGAESSMAGQFDSVLGIRGVDEFTAAVQTVLDSRVRAGAADQPIAVLVQPLIEPVFGGVLFGVDPVSGRSDRRVVSVVRGGPEPLVSGRANGARYVLDAHGHVIESDVGDGPKLRTRDLRRLTALAARVSCIFGAPQDVEWAIGTDGRLWVLQSRPVTTEVRGAPSGAVYGPGPVAETFPLPLSRLEEDLWVPPLREAVREAVLLGGAATRVDLRDSDVVVAVDGRVAIDLKLAGDIPTRRSNALHPVRAAASVRSAWRVGRLRAALPRLAENLLRQTDRDLAAVPSLRTLTVEQLSALLHRAQPVLRALHAHEILMGMLVSRAASQVTGVSVALRTLARGRAAGHDDSAITRRSPVVLALTPPRIGPVDLPPDVDAPAPPPDDADVDETGVLREALRLRARWVQELTARAAWELGARLLAEPSDVRHLHLDEVDAIATGRAVAAPSVIAAAGWRQNPTPLPVRFQLSDLGKAVAAPAPRRAATAGTGAGGGQGAGIVTYDDADPPDGSVLVTRTLSPGLGPLLPRLRGIVAETGSVLSHLAILAREFGVPTVVGYAGAVDLFAEGTLVEVDGDTGEVRR